MHPDQRLGPVMPGVDGRSGRRHPDREIGVAFAQVAQQHVDIGAVDLEAQVGPPHPRAGQPERDAGRGEVAGRADPHRLRRRARPGDVENLVVDRQQPPRVIDDKLAGRRQADAGRALVEQVGAEQALQPLDLRADRRLRHAERVRRLGEAAQIDDGDQGPQQLGRNIGHDTFAPHGSSGRIGTATNWVVQVVIPTCGFRPPNPCFKSATILWHLIFHFYYAKIAQSYADSGISCRGRICCAGTRLVRVAEMLAGKRASVGAPDAAASGEFRRSTQPESGNACARP